MLRLEKIGLELQDQEKTTTILHDIDIEFAPGKIYAVTGPNGGGKSSLAKVIMGIYRPTAGKVVFQGEDITALSVTERAEKGLGYAFQNPPRFKGLTVTDLLEIAARRNGNDQAHCQPLLRIGLCPDDYRNRQLDSSLSGGEMKRIEIATLLMQDPRFRIFDEPEAGIDLWSFERLLQVIRESHRGDHTTVIISHQEKILNMVDQIVLVADGTIQLQGDKNTIWPMIRDGAVCSCRQNCRQEGDLNADCPR